MALQNSVKSKFIAKKIAVKKMEAQWNIYIKHSYTEAYGCTHK